MTKIGTTYRAVRPIAIKDIEPDAVRIGSRMFIKEKHDGGGDYTKTAARLAAGGHRMPDGSFGETHASTVDESYKNLVIAAFFADAVKNGYLDSMEVSDFDIPGAFLNCELTKENSPHQIVMFILKDIPHPLAGTWVEVLRGIYGLKQSNNIFEKDLCAVFASAGFLPTPADPSIYIKVDKDNPSLKCIVPMHVDDGLAVHNCRRLYQDLISALELRYGPITKHETSTSYTGQKLTRSPSGAISLSVEGYIVRFLHEIGMDNIPTAETPSTQDLFHEPTDKTPVDKKLFDKIIGSLIYILKSRHDIRKEVVHLSSRKSAPTASDLVKTIRVLRYLKGTPTLGPTFFTNEGAILYGHVDASYGVHTNGRSQSGFYISIGRHSAPIYCHSGAQKSCVSTGSMEAEYVALAAIGKKIEAFRYFLDNIGFTQIDPTTIFEDNKSAINLAQAPQISRKSRHIHTRHHYIRFLVKSKAVKITYLPTSSMTADILTKPLGPTKFIPFRNALLNIS